MAAKYVFKDSKDKDVRDSVNNVISILSDYIKKEVFTSKELFNMIIDFCLIDTPANKIVKECSSSNEVSNNDQKYL